MTLVQPSLNCYMQLAHLKSPEGEEPAAPLAIQRFLTVCTANVQTWLNSYPLPTFFMKSY